MSSANASSGQSRISLGNNQRDVFVRFCRRLKNEIVCFEGKGDPTIPPPSLPPQVHEFLSAALHIHPTSVTHLWTELRDETWESDWCGLSKEEFEVFVLHGTPLLSEGRLDQFPVCALQP